MTLDQVQKNAYAETAVGNSLDLIVADRGISRKSATAAVRLGFFDVEVSAGSRFSTINGASSVVFAVGEYTGMDGNYYAYEMTCETAGTIGNSYSGNILPITAISGLTYAAIGEIITEGTDEEEDDSLRQRYLDTFEVASFGGNIASYRSAILAIEGVGGVQVYPAWQGGGTVLCSIINSNLSPADNALVAAVQSAICPPEDGETSPSANGYGVAPIGAAVTIVSATQLVIDVSCKVQFAASVQNGEVLYKEAIESAIADYIKTVASAWGDELKTQTVSYPVVIYTARIMVAILSIEDIVNVSDVAFNGVSGDLVLTQTAELQQIPTMGTVTINGN